MRRKERGFTLLEAILVTLLVGGVFLAVTVALSSFGAAWERGEKRYAAREEIWLLWRRIEAELSSLLTPPFGLGPSFVGDTEGFRFFSGDPAAGEGPWEARLSLVGDRLVLTRIPLRRPAEEKEEIPLAWGIERVSFSYWDPAARTWRSVWTEEQSRPPSLVRLELVFSHRRGRAAWPALLFPVYVGRVLAAGEVDPVE
ncbi:MAG: hypothetical protein ACUVRM_05245 [Bacillota bacterium]